MFFQLIFKSDTFQLPESISYFQENINWVCIPNFISQNVGIFIEFLFRLRTIVFTSLLTTPEDEKKQKQYLKQINFKNKNNRKKLNYLVDQINTINTNQNEKVNF